MKKILVIVLVFVSSISFAQTNESQATYEDYMQNAKDRANSGQYFEAIQECNKAINLEVLRLVLEEEKIIELGIVVAYEFIKKECN